jgi:tetratricopeptide (TPR) repeat protein
LENRNSNLARLTAAIILAALLAGCAGSAGTWPEDEVDTRVRQPAQQDSAGIQVYPLENPAVTELLAGAGAAESRGDYDQAVVMLERALRIQPRNPESLQQMAELQLQQRDWSQALNFAARSYDVGPRVGEICSRNWRTISVAREYLGDSSGSAEAEKRARNCMSTKPAGM